MSLVADHLVHSGVTQIRSTLLNFHLSAYCHICIHKIWAQFKLKTCARGNKEKGRSEHASRNNTPEPRWHPDRWQLATVWRMVAMSHPSIQSETSRPVSDAALCIFAPLTLVSWLCVLAQHLPGFSTAHMATRQKTQQKQTWEELFYWPVISLWMQRVYHPLENTSPAQKMLIFLFFTVVKSKLVLLLLWGSRRKRTFTTYNTQCHLLTVFFTVFNCSSFPLFPRPDLSRSALTRSLGCTERPHMAWQSTKTTHFSNIGSNHEGRHSALSRTLIW